MPPPLPLAAARRRTRTSCSTTTASRDGGRGRGRGWGSDGMGRCCCCKWQEREEKPIRLSSGRRTSPSSCHRYIAAAKARRILARHERTNDPGPDPDRIDRARIERVPHHLGRRRRQRQPAWKSTHSRYHLELATVWRRRIDNNNNDDGHESVRARNGSAPRRKHNVLVGGGSSHTGSTLSFTRRD